jgi:N-methylhydantoinase A/oxoprolinase/acetone carboxylase beta subunit
VHIASDRNLVDVRFPVQYVIRPQSNSHVDYRGYAGQVAGGILKAGDEVMVLPSGFTTTIASIETADGPVDEAFVEQVEARFHDAHERSYGYCYRDDPQQLVEWVNLRVTGVGAIARPALEPLAAEGNPLTGERPVYFGDRWHDAPVYARERLAGQVAGPAVIQEFGSTLPIHPGFTARVDDLGNVVVTR